MTLDWLIAQRGRDVSRETYGRLGRFVAILEKWNPRINLVSRSTLAEVWTRHILDSVQLFDIAHPGAGLWVDLGSGGGFPGLVVAALAAEEAPDLRVGLVESDQRKAAFLATAARDMGVTVQVHAARIESVQPLAADYLSARALAPLDQLLAYAERHLRPSGRAYLPKGQTHADELAQALASRRFAYEKHPSKTDSQAVILEIWDLTRG